MSVIRLATVDDSRQVEASHRNFIKGLLKAKTRAVSLVRRTWYWVYDPGTRTFSPSKFSGYVGMDFARYDAAREGESEGAKFDGWISQNAIAKVLGDYEPDANLARELEAWAQAVLGPGALEGIEPGKWRFVRLPSVGVGGLAALAGGWEDSDELADSLSEARRSPGRTPPELTDR